MIGKVTRSWDARAVVRYLMGPGTSGQHTDPTVIACWHGDPGALQPPRDESGRWDGERWDYLVGRLAATAEAVGLPRRAPAVGEPMHTTHGYVWQLMAAVESDVPALGHDTWAHIARDVMDRTGIGPDDDFGACRWLAIHHGSTVDGRDHMHVVATLLRQDGPGSRFHPKRDYFAVRAVMRDWEDRLGVRPTGRRGRPA